MLDPVLDSMFACGGRSGLYSGYSVIDIFAVADAAPLASPRSVEKGIRTAVETDGALAVSSSSLTSTAQTTPVWGDLGCHWAKAGPAAVTRSAGLLLVCNFNVGTWEEWGLGWHTAAAVVDPDSMQHAIQANGTDGQLDNELGIAIATGLSNSTEYRIAIGLRSTGAFYYLYASGAWSLIYVSNSGATASLYPSFAVLDGVVSLVGGDGKGLRVPTTTYSPTPTVSDGFADVDATALEDHATDGAGAGESGGSGVVWTKQSVGSGAGLSISSNKLICDGGGSRAIYSCPGVLNGIASVTYRLTAIVVGQDPYIACRLQDGNDHWLADVEPSNDSLRIYERNAGAFTNRATVTLTGAQTLDTDRVLTVMVNGTVITAWWEGFTCSYTSMSTHTDKTLWGLHAGGVATPAIVFDNFVLFPVAQASFPSV